MEESREPHPAQWWAQFPEASERFDAAMVVDGFGDLLVSRIVAPLLRQETRLAVDVVVRYLNRPASAELKTWAVSAATRLSDTLRRFEERSTGDHSLAEAGASGSVGPNLDELRPDAATVDAKVTNGGGGMPAFGGRLTRAEIANVAAYVAGAAGGGGGGGDVGGGGTP